MDYRDEIALWLYRFRDGKDMMGNKIDEEKAVNGIILAFQSTGWFYRQCSRKHVEEEPT